VATGVSAESIEDARGGSAAGTKPGRDGFSVLFGGGYSARSCTGGRTVPARVGSGAAQASGTDVSLSAPGALNCAERAAAAIAASPPSTRICLKVC
jgi:hypothetical protein